MHHFWPPNGSFAPKFFFWKKIINIIFIYLLASFILQNLKKILKANPDLWGCSTFGSKIPQFVLNKFFWHKPLLLLSSTYWPFSLCTILKNSSSRSRVMRMCNVWAQNGPFPWMRIFFRKSLNEPCFFHSYWSTCQKSKSDIYLLVKYWQLKNTKTLAWDDKNIQSNAPYR